MQNGTKPFTIVDFNNFWSPSGGGVRRYHLQKMAFYEAASSKGENALSVFVMPDGKTFTEQKSENLVIEHVEAFKFPGNWEYRFIWKRSQVEPVLAKYQPDIIEVGSPYILPTVVRRAAKKISPASKLVGFWHADFPVTYVGRPVAKKVGPGIGTFCRKKAFWYARKEFKGFDCIQASSKEVMARLKKNNLPDPRWIPLGCDIQMFSPTKRDEALVQELKAGDPDRLTIFFPHRHCNEKGMDLVLGAYDILTEKLGHEPAIVFAGTGPSLPQVQEAVAKHPHMRYIGFVNSIDEMARYYASVDLGLALSGWETFGLSILESMASGNAQVGAAAGAAFEHVTESKAGTILAERTPQALANAIVELYHSDMQTMKQNARAYAEKYSWEDCFKRQLDLYKSLAK
ncbi:glycosyltransferase [Fibrobacter sp. UWP2]|uniref:glycosyltransferase n=1 Tax=Fibrobacter sp. UWP2 TaxID=1896216 RepID=UPI00092314FA|nr:glycosyltransferase [Fibrobacter sp. UWP2]SHI77297.1 alpha-1,6-mannosyltransferase [Fibrobacter sp. UWP2]